MAEEKSQQIDIEFESLEVSPNDCELSKELSICGTYKSSLDLQAKWKFSYVVDSSFSKHVINLGECVNQQITKDKVNALKFQIDQIDISNINDSTLFNTGLLKLELINEKSNEEIITVNIVTQITKDGNKLIRTFFNPLEC